MLSNREKQVNLQKKCCEVFALCITVFECNTIKVLSPHLLDFYFLQQRKTTLDNLQKDVIKCYSI